MHVCIHVLVHRLSPFFSWQLDNNTKRVHDTITTETPRFLLHCVCQCCESKIISVDTVCTSTTVLRSCRGVDSSDSFDTEDLTLLCLAKCGRPACRADEEARGARFATIYICYISHEPQQQLVVRKTRAITRKIPESDFRHSFLDRPTLNALATSEHNTRHPSPYSPHSSCHHYNLAVQSC